MLRVLLVLRGVLALLPGEKEEIAVRSGIGLKEATKSQRSKCRGLMRTRHEAKYKHAKKDQRNRNGKGAYYVQVFDLYYFFFL
jgi:hypothetical protein